MFPPTLVSFATAIGNTANVMSPEFKKANSSVVILKPQYKDGMPEIGSLLSIYKIVEQMIDEGKAVGRSNAGLRRRCRSTVQDVRRQPRGSVPEP